MSSQKTSISLKDAFGWSLIPIVTTVIFILFYAGWWNWETNPAALPGLILTVATSLILTIVLIKNDSAGFAAMLTFVIVIIALFSLYFGAKLYAVGPHGHAFWQGFAAVIDMVIFYGAMLYSLNQVFGQHSHWK